MTKWPAPGADGHLRESTLDVRAFGAVGDGVTDDTEAVQDAVSAASAQDHPPAVFFPAGNYIVTSDIEVTADDVCFRGVGDGSLVEFQNAGFHFNGQGGFLFRNQMHDLKIQRFGPSNPGPAVRFSGGGGSGTGCARFFMSNVNIDNSTHSALTIDGSFLGTIVGCYFRNSDFGIEIVQDPVLGTIGANAVTFVGGECQNNDQAAYLSWAVGVSFQGMTFEGSAAAGVELSKRCWGVTFDGCYWEANVGYDVAVGTESGGVPRAVSLTGGIHTAGSTGTAHAIQLRRCTDATVATSTFANYSAEPIAVTEFAGGFLSAAIRDCYTQDAAPLVDLNSAPNVSWPAGVGRGQGTTSRRPSSPPAGTQWFDTDLGHPIWFDGSGWVDGAGTSV